MVVKVNKYIYTNIYIYQPTIVNTLRDLTVVILNT